jgi:hypothetical protein
VLILNDLLTVGITFKWRIIYSVFLLTEVLTVQNSF